VPVFLPGPQLEVAVRAPFAAVERQHDGALVQDVAQLDALAGGVRQGEVRRDVTDAQAGGDARFVDAGDLPGDQLGDLAWHSELVGERGELCIQRVSHLFSFYCPAVTRFARRCLFGAGQGNA